MSTAGCSPLGFDFDSSELSEGIVAEARPRPIFRFLYEAACDRVAVQVAQLLDLLLFAVDIEIVISDLPEGAFFTAQSHGKFERFDGLIQCVLVWLTNEQMHMLGHDNVTGDNELVAQTDTFEGVLEEVA